MKQLRPQLFNTCQRSQSKEMGNHSELWRSFIIIPIPWISYHLCYQVNVSMISVKSSIKMFLRSGLLEEEGWLLNDYFVPAIYLLESHSLEKSHDIHFTDKEIDGLANCSNSQSHQIVKCGGDLYIQFCLSSRPRFSFFTPFHVAQGKPQIVLDFGLPIISYRSVSYFAGALLSPSFHLSWISF